MKKYTVLGIMSGTSLDGIDLALCEFVFDNKWSFKILNTKEIDYSQEWRNKLATAMDLSGENLAKLDVVYGRFLGEKAKEFLQEINKTADFIASHGHTIFHQPEEKFTLQIGCGAALAAVSGISTINNFRALDVALGGQGAPLVPIGDMLLFSEFDYCINIGGFANISFEQNNERIAFDISPANIVANHITRKIGFEFDNEGNFGKKGKLNLALLNELNNFEYYNLSAPKSLGKEWLDKNFMPFLEKYDISIEDKLHTLYKHIAFQINKATENSEKKKILITGGGAKNSFLISLIKQETKHEVIIPTTEIIDFKEAIIFAFLGVLRMRNENNCLKSVTGAERDNCGGSLWLI